MKKEGGLLDFEYEKFIEIKEQDRHRGKKDQCRNCTEKFQRVHYLYFDSADVEFVQIHFPDSHFICDYLHWSIKDYTF